MKIDSIAFLLTFFFGSMALTATAQRTRPGGVRPGSCPRGFRIEYVSPDSTSDECLALTFACDENKEKFVVPGCGCGCRPGIAPAPGTGTGPPPGTGTGPPPGTGTGTGPPPETGTGTGPPETGRRCNFLSPSCDEGLECIDFRGICAGTERLRCPGKCLPSATSEEVTTP
jgi:hypothetical protein